MIVCALQDVEKGETRFTSKKSAKEIVNTIEEAARPLGFNVQIQNHKLKLQGDKQGRKGPLSVSTQVCVLFVHELEWLQATQWSCSYNTELLYFYLSAI